MLFTRSIKCWTDLRVFFEFAKNLEPKICCFWTENVLLLFAISKNCTFMSIKISGWYKVTTK